MYAREYFYRDFDGVHYPDAEKGTKYTYGVDFRYFLRREGGILKDVDWFLEEGLNGKPAGVENNIASILIETPWVGTYTVTCKMHYEVDGLAEHITVPLQIRVG